MLVFLTVVALEATQQKVIFINTSYFELWFYFTGSDGFELDRVVEPKDFIQFDMPNDEEIQLDCVPYKKTGTPALGLRYSIKACYNKQFSFNFKKVKDDWIIGDLEQNKNLFLIVYFNGKFVIG